MLLLFVAVVAVALIVTSQKKKYKLDDPPLLPDTTALEIVVPVRVLEIIPQDFQEILTVNGVLEAKLRTLLSSETGGRVKLWKADIGELLDSGEVILEFDNELTELNFKQASAQLKSVEVAAAKQKRDYNRLAALFKQGAMSKSEFEGAALALKAAEANLAGAQAAAGMAERSFRESNVRMPYTGRLSAKHVEVGQVIPPGTPVCEIVQLNPIRLSIGVPEEEIVRIRTGQEVSVKTVGWKDRSFIGKIKAVGLAADLAARLFPVEIHIPNKNRELIPGMAATTSIILRTHKNALIIPRDAVDFDGEKAFVYVIKGDKAEKRYIKRGVSNDAEVTVESGLVVKETIVIVGQHSLKPGQKIKITTGEEN